MAVGMGCGGGGDGSDVPGTGTGTGTGLETPRASNFLALVSTPGDQTDPTYKPVAHATIDGLGVTAMTGVAIGDSAPDPAKWYKVQAAGYASNYMRAIGDLSGKLIFESVLTPVDSRATYSPGTDAVLQDDPENTTLELVVPGNVFAEDTVFLELTRIAPPNLGPLYAQNLSGQALYPQIIFCIEAYDTSGDKANFLSGKTATVRITDNGVLGALPVLAWFNPDSGLWEALAPGMCTRVDANTIEATLNHFSTYGGMTGDVPTTSPSQEYTSARSRYQAAVNDWAAQGGGHPVPDAVLDALEDMAAAAEQFAEGNANEIAKQRLLSVMAAAQLIGEDDVSNRLWLKAQDVTRVIARELIDDPDCGRLQEMLICMTQCQLLGLETENEQLQAKIRELLAVCSNWHGKISYTMDMENPYPEYDDMNQLGGPGAWTELHEVVLSINPENYHITGDDLASLSASNVTYRAPEESGCASEDYYELQNYAVPASGTTFLRIDGSFQPGVQPGERPAFTLNQPVKESGNIMIFFKQSYLWHDEDCNPNVMPMFNMPIIPEYHSLLVGVGESPPKTLTEMLNSGSYHDHGDVEIIQGYERVPLNASATGFWPFTHTTIRWHFVHVKPTMESETP